MELLLIASAYGAGLLASRLMLPPLVGYLVAGYGLNAMGIKPEELLSHLAEIGILLMLFTVGLKIRLRSLLKPEVLGVGGLHLLIVAGFSGVLFMLEHQTLTGGLLLGISLAFSSTVLAVKVLESTGELSTFHGRTVLGILILQDITAVGLLAFTGAKTPSYWAFGLLLLPMLRPLAQWIFRISRGDELRLLLGILLAFAGGELANSVGISQELGSLMMGVLLAGNPEVDDLSRKLWGLKEALLVAFFLEIGLAGFPDTEQLWQALALLALLPLQGGLIYLLLVLTGLRARTAFVSSLALTTYSEFALIATEPAIKSGLLSAQWEQTLGFAVAVSLAVAALLNRFADPLYNWMKPVVGKLQRRMPHPDQLPPSLGNAQWLILGMGQTGKAAYDALDKRRIKVVGLDADPDRVIQLKQAGYRAVYGDASDRELWANLALKNIRGLIVSIPDFAIRERALALARDRGFSGLIGTTAFDTAEARTLYQLRATRVFHPLSEAGALLAEQLLELETPEPMT